MGVLKFLVFCFQVAGGTEKVSLHCILCLNFALI